MGRRGGEERSITVKALQTCVSTEKSTDLVFPSEDACSSINPLFFCKAERLVVVSGAQGNGSGLGGKSLRR